MSWKEGLRALDADLAAGKISADEYRIRRDQLLSSAVSNPLGPADTPPGVSETTQLIPPITDQTPPPGQQATPAQPPAAAPTPGPAAAQSPTPAPGDEDKTQVVPADLAGDRTQTVSSERTQAVSWRAERPGDADRTQVVPGAPGQAPGQGGYPPPAFPRPPWEQEQQRFDEGTPWGGSEFPPLAAPYGNEAWVRQGPEVFEGGGSGKKGRVVAIVLAVVVLAGLGVGAWFLWGAGDSDPAAGPSTAPVQTTTVPPTTTTPPDPMPVAELPGKEEKHKKVKAFTDVPALNYLNPEELAAYEATAPEMAKFNVRHLPSGTTAVFLLVQTPDPARGETAATALGEIQVENGAAVAKDAEPGVQITEIEAKDGQPGQIRAHYLSGDVLVRVEVWNPDSLAKAKADFPEVLAAQLALLPADV